MVNRALGLATVTRLIVGFVIGGFALTPALAQNQNLEAGKSPAQIFAGACNACHKSPRGLLRTIAPGSLPGFLKEHYTTSPDMASLLSAYLISNGATDTRYAAKPGKDERPEAPAGLTDQIGRRLRSAMPQEVKPDEQAVKPDADRPGLPAAEPGRHGHKRLARSSEPSDPAKPAADGQVPAQLGGERGFEGRKSAARQRRGRPAGEETPRIDVRREEPTKSDAPKEDGSIDGSKSDTNVRLEVTRPDAAKPPVDNKSDSAGIEPQKPAGSGETPALRPDPVPPVTPAPASTAASATISGGASEPVAEPAVVVPQPSPQTVAPPPSAPVAPAGPPAPPISQ